MRLWHKDLIKVLPREQLVAQWRELSAIAGNLSTKGTPNHILVNKVLEYSREHFISYAFWVRQEMARRGYRTMESVWNKIYCTRETDYGELEIIPWKICFLIGTMTDTLSSAILILRRNVTAAVLMKNGLEKYRIFILG